ncbi:DNA-processing protein DprA [Williamsia phyllosphaerae]|uniref:Smf/DprA SLOG domain-containing protein n=1 Tax=Williamsia phyllosphaerae TaxID=885042 RepID=A0ABQ1V7P3_9NOCA|nr:DNA-processing protein DprA [Williamsia phyllosphaerae]GGF39781.1 hypothetical protein GCM10007298_39380 [Williamsia phyllosphaerae]
MDARERLAWAYLAAVSEPPSAAVIRLVDAVGVVDAAQAVATRCVPEGHQGVLRPTAARYEKDTARTDLETAERMNGRLVTPVDDEWPGWALHALTMSDTAPRGGPPLALWVRGGGRLDAITDRAVAVVGSRASTGYGQHITSKMVTGLIGSGRGVVSGGAYGIDGSAHRAALASDGLTAAVLACGFDIDYPTGHTQLFAGIVADGVVVSEYPPGTSAGRHRFLTRNRLVAALSKAVVVMEAGRRSGSLNTAAWAVKCGVPVGAVPGPVTSAMSVGCHRMIRDGQAQLVMDADDIEHLITPDGVDDAAGTTRRPDERTLDDVQSRVRDAIPGRGSATIAEIAFAAGIEVARTRSALAMLETYGLVASDGSGWRLPAR